MGSERNGRVARASRAFWSDLRVQRNVMDLTCWARGTLVSRGTDFTEPGSSIRGSITFQYFEKAAPSSAMGQPQCLPRRVSPSVMSRKMLKDRRVFGERARGGLGGGGGAPEMFPLRKGRPNWRAQADARQGHEKPAGVDGRGRGFFVAVWARSGHDRGQRRGGPARERAAGAAAGRGRERSSTAERGGPGGRLLCDVLCRAEIGGEVAPLKVAPDSVAGHGEAREP